MAKRPGRFLLFSRLGWEWWVVDLLIGTRSDRLKVVTEKQEKTVEPNKQTTGPY